MAKPVITFIIDECLNSELFGEMLTRRGHRFTTLAVKTKDPTIIIHAEEQHAIVITADAWFYDQLRRNRPEPVNSGRRFRAAGVIRVPGAQGNSVVGLVENKMPLIEFTYSNVVGTSDERVVVWVQPTQTIVD